MPSLVSSRPVISAQIRPAGENQHAVADLGELFGVGARANHSTCLAAAAARSAARFAGACRHRRPGSARRAATASGLRFIQRAMRTFWALPPDRERQFHVTDRSDELRSARPSSRASRTIAPRSQESAAEKAIDVRQEHVVDDGQTVDTAGVLPVARQQREIERHGATLATYPTAGSPARSPNAHERPERHGRAPKTRYGASS